MGMLSYIREEIRVVKERDPAIKSSMEVLLYPSFKVILRYRVAHKIISEKSIIFWPDGFPSVQPEKRESRSIRAHRSGKGCLLITEAE